MIKCKFIFQNPPPPTMTLLMDPVLTCTIQHCNNVGSETWHGSAKICFLTAYFFLLHAKPINLANINKNLT